MALVDPSADAIRVGANLVRRFDRAVYGTVFCPGDLFRSDAYADCNAGGITELFEPRRPALTFGQAGCGCEWDRPVLLLKSRDEFFAVRNALVKQSV